jgi:preprotein translocase subunit SecA
VGTDIIGRAADIKLAPGVAELGGLAVIGIEHKRNPRKDDQMRGRGGRQGQPGSSQFYVTPSDAFFSHLPAHRVRKLAAKFATDRIGPLDPSTLRAYQKEVKRAHQNAELGLAKARKISTHFDSVIEVQRKNLLATREEIVHSNTLVEEIHDWQHDELEPLIEAGEWDKVAAFLREIDPKSELRPTTREAAKAALDGTLEAAVARTRAARKEDPGAFLQYVRGMFLFNLDQYWIEYLDAKEEIRRGAVLEMYAARDPFVSYTRRSAEAFSEMLKSLRTDIASRYRFHLATQGPRS